MIRRNELFRKRYTVGTLYVRLIARRTKGGYEVRFQARTKWWFYRTGNVFITLNYERVMPEIKRIERNIHKLQRIVVSRSIKSITENIL